MSLHRGQVGSPKNRLEYLGLSGVLGLLRAMPLDRSRRAGEAMAGFMMRVAPVRKERALKNIAMVFPDMTSAEGEAVYEGMMRNLGRMLGDYAHMPKRDAQDMVAACPLQGRENLEALHEEGKGGVLLTGHYGNWELLGAAASSLNLPMVILGARQRNPYVEAMFNENRIRFGSEALSLGDGLRPLVKRLKAGRILATLADQDGGRNGMFLDFMGTTASVNPGVFRLMARLNVPMITGFSWWNGSGWEGQIDAPIDPSSFEGDVEVKAAGLATLYNRRLEEMIRARPDHWFWVHHRWRSRPASVK